MLVLVATQNTQGQAPDDYCWTVDGELVTPVAAECDSGSRCGCDRGFPGLASSRATTTALVVDRPGLDVALLRACLGDSLERGGWARLLPADEFEDLVDEHLEVIELIGRSFPVGTVVCRRGNHVFARASADVP